MSEIKGQLFGILLVVAVFGVVGATLVSAFQDAANNVKEKITEEVDLTPKEEAIRINNFVIDNELMSF